MSDERYDRSADMRLLELQREALGVPPRVVASTSYTDPDPVSDAVKDDSDAYVQRGTILIATIDAQPCSSLIAGALVTILMSVANDGDVPARSVRMSLALPPDTTYRPGTLAIDGTAESETIAREFFENGADIGNIEPGARRTLVIKLVMEAGLSDIVLSPHLSAASGAVLGLRAIRLTRSRRLLRGVDVELPFYESDETEHAREPIAAAPPQPTLAEASPRQYTPTEASPSTERLPPKAAELAREATAKAIPKHSPQTKANPKPRAKPKSKSKAPAQITQKPVAERVRDTTLEPVPEPLARPKIDVVRSIDDRISFSGQGGPILAVRIDRKRLTTLTGLFSGASLGMIAHYLVLNALAARDPMPGDGTDGSIAAFVANQEQLLSRALISTRLGKTPTPDSVGAALPAFPPALATHAERRAIESPPKGEAMLFRAFQPSEVTFVRRIISNDNAAPFMRAAQLFVGLCANDAVVADERERRRAGVALTAYAALATAEISQIFLRAKLSREPALFKSTDSAFDDAAKKVLAALADSIT